MVKHPTEVDHPPLPASPLLLMLTTDGKLRLFFWGHTSTSWYKARPKLVRPPEPLPAAQPRYLEGLEAPIPAGAPVPEPADDLAKAAGG